MTNLKLSKYIGIYDDIEQNEKKNHKNINNLKDENIFYLNSKDIHKIYNSKNHKTYYNESDIKISFNKIKD